MIRQTGGRSVVDSRSRPTDRAIRRLRRWVQSQLVLMVDQPDRREPDLLVTAMLGDG